MLKKVKTLSATEAVAQRLLEMIEQGELKPGDRLPTEGELSVAFGVGRSSIREAKRILIAKNLVESISGKGTFIRAQSAEEVLSPDLIYNLLAEETKSDLEEARGMIEIRSIQLAVEKADENDIEELEGILARMEEQASRGIVDYEAGLAFHQAIIDATHNSVFVKLYEVIAELLKIHQADPYTASADPVKEFEEHKALLEAIKERNLSEAVHLMGHHLEYVKEVEDLYGSDS